MILLAVQCEARVPQGHRGRQIYTQSNSCQFSFMAPGRSGVVSEDSWVGSTREAKREKSCAYLRSLSIKLNFY